MSSERAKRGFMPADSNKSLDVSNPEFYETAQRVQTIEDSLYYWAAVFNPPRRGSQWSGRSAPANIVRETLLANKNVRFISRENCDERLYSPDHNLVREVRRQEKKEGRDRQSCAEENLAPQLSDWSPHQLWLVKSLILEVLSVCTRKEKRLFAFILFENSLTQFLTTFEDKNVLGEFYDIVTELTQRVLEEKERAPKGENQLKNIFSRVNKRNFVTQRPGEWNKREYSRILKSFREKTKGLVVLETDQLPLA
jgi:hypothetical protein